MNKYFYYKCIRNTIVQFLDVFNNIKIAKYNKNGDVYNFIEVPLRFMPKQKWYMWIFDRTHEKRLPSMGVEITNISYDSERATGKHEKIEINRSLDGKHANYVMNLIPYKIEFSLRVASLYVNEMDQIAEQILPFFDPFVYTKVEIPELDLNWDLKVLFNGSASIDASSEISEDDLRTNIWEYTFTVDTYLLKPLNSITTVHEIINKLYTTEEAWKYHGTSSEMPSGHGHESEEILIKGTQQDENYLKYDEAYYTIDETESVNTGFIKIIKKSYNPKNMDEYQDGVIWKNTLTNETFIKIDNEWVTFGSSNNIAQSIYFSRKAGV